MNFVKRKDLLFISGIIVICLTCFTNVKAAGIIDLDGDGIPDKYIPCNTEISVDTTTYRVGEKSLKVEATGGEGNNDLRLYGIPIKSATFYSLKVWYKSVELNEGYIYITQTLQPEPKRREGSYGKKLNPSADWQEVEFTFATYPDIDSMNLFFRLWPAKKGVVLWLNGMELKEGQTIAEFLKEEQKEVEKIESSGNEEIQAKCKEVKQYIGKIMQILYKPEVASNNSLKELNELIEKEKASKKELEILQMLK